MSILLYFTGHSEWLNQLGYELENIAPQLKWSNTKPYQDLWTAFTRTTLSTSRTAISPFQNMVCIFCIKKLS